MRSTHKQSSYQARLKACATWVKAEWTVLIAIIISHIWGGGFKHIKLNLHMLNIHTQWDSTVFTITDRQYSLNIYSGNDAEWLGIENSVKILSENYTRVSRQIVSLVSSYLFENKISQYIGDHCLVSLVLNWTATFNVRNTGIILEFGDHYQRSEVIISMKKSNECRSFH